MAGLGHLIDRLLVLNNWKSILFNPLRKAEIADIIKQLNEIDLEGNIVTESEQVEHRPASRAHAPSDLDLWKREKKINKINDPYW